METNKYYKRSRGGIWAAAILIIVGVFLLFSNSGVFFAEYKRIFISWQMLLIVLGLIAAVHSFPHGGFGGLFVSITGFFFLIPKIRDNDMTLFGWEIPQSFVADYWAILLIIAGLLVLKRAFIRPSYKYKKWSSHVDAGTSCRDYFKKKHGKAEINTIFSNGKHIVLDEEFKGTEINTIFGETTLDLRKTTLPEGDTFMEVNVIFGNTEIILPANWNVVLRATPIFGQFSDNRALTEENIDRSRTLIIDAHSIFSGGVIRS